MSLLKLPKEILRVIWSFIVDVRDVIRFSSTCKLIQSLAFDVDRNLYINDGAPIELWKRLFSQDLRRVTSLVVNLDLYPNNSEYISTILDILPIISNCQSLKTLTMVITETYEDPDFSPTFQKLSAAIKQMPWLEYLCIGFTIDYNIGEYFKDHSKLTTLAICEKNADGIGYEKLTQIKRLRISCNAGDDILQQVLDLTNLTDLDLRDSLVTKNTTEQLWKLTNLEIMDISGLEIGDRVDWRVFKKLPKLSTLMHERDHNSSIPYEEYQYDIMNSLTQLTLLGIRTGFGHPFPLEKISNLTNLRALSVAVNSSYEDFAKFPHLTYLNVTLGTKVERIQFPKGLKMMAIDTFPHKDAIFKEIGDLDSLTELSLYYPDTKKLHHISRLTNLEWLTFGKEQLSPGYIVLLIFEIIILTVFFAGPQLNIIRIPYKKEKASISPSSADKQKVKNWFRIFWTLDIALEFAWTLAFTPTQTEY